MLNRGKKKRQLATDLENQPTAVLNEFKKRMAMAMGPHHYLANMLDHRFQGKSMSDSQKSEAYEYLGSVNADLIHLLWHCSLDMVEDLPQTTAQKHFLESVSNDVVECCHPVHIQSMADENLQSTVRKQLLSVCSQLLRLQQDWSVFSPAMDWYTQN